MEILKKIQANGIVPVIKITNVEDALPLAKALVDGGLNVAEITFRTKVAQQAIQKIHEALPAMLLGAGTVLTCEQVDEAMKAGAQFIVSPGFDERVVRYCQQKDILIIPGCSNASEIQQAISMGLSTVKFFPAEAAGGVTYIKALSGPFSDMHFMPTGGVNEKNMMEYLENANVIACGGTWMVKDNLIKEKKFSEIQELTKDAVLKMLDIHLYSYSLEKNRLTLSTSSLERARYHLGKKGILFDENNHMLSKDYDYHITLMEA